MNPFVKVSAASNGESVNTILEANSLGDKQYAAIVYCFKSFTEAQALNDLARKHDIPFYCLNSSGLYGFFFADVGKECKFNHLRKETQIEEEHVITDSQTFKEYLTSLANLSTKLSWNRREFIKPTKFLLLSILAKYF